MFSDGYRFNVLFLCTQNSARSVLGEAILNHKADPRFRAFSAGSHPAGAVNPQTLEILREKGIPTSGLRSKSWDEFAVPGAPKMDFIFTVCDAARNETCPVWPGSPMTAHWGVADPAAAPSAQRHAAFEHAYGLMAWRIERLLSLRFSTLTRLSLLSELETIGLAA